MVPATPAAPAVASSSLQSSPATKKMKSRLFVGEGSFSYTEALLKKHKDKPGLAGAIIATELQLERNCDCVSSFLFPELNNQKCDQCVQVAQRIERLKGMGVKVRLGIDATKISEHFKGKRFQRIHWNIPHDGSNYKAQTLPSLIFSFFFSCASCQIAGDRVHITLPQPRKGQAGYDFYQAYIYDIVLASATPGYQLVKKRQFVTRYRDYGYEHVKTKKMEKADVVDEQAREFVFQKVESFLALNSHFSTQNKGNQVLLIAQELKASSPKKYTIETGNFYKEQRYYYDCETDEDSSNYSDADSDGEGKAKEKQDITAGITTSMQMLQLSKEGSSNIPKT